MTTQQQTTVLKMHPTQELQYMEQLRSATPGQLELARQFQRTAFAGERNYEPGFIPAPLYLKQALAISASPILAAELVSAIATVAGH